MKKGHKRVRCPVCNGQGTIIQGSGRNKTERTCDACRGTGEV